MMLWRQVLILLYDVDGHANKQKEAMEPYKSNYN